MTTKNKKTSQSSRKPAKRPLTRTERIKVHFSGFLSPFVIFSSIVLLLTSVWWSVLGASVQSRNADQLVNSFLFQDPQTFQGALFPSAHTFLIKWPLFLIERIFGHSEFVLVVLTVLVSVATVAGLTYILYRIDRRPKVFGTVMLALAGILLFIPAQASAGSLLPVNFAMLTTRNIEYLVYILSIVLLIRSQKVRSWQFIGAVAALSLLIASDKLFMWVSLGSAVIAIIVYAFAKRPALARLGARWLGVSLMAAVISTLLLWMMNTIHVTHIVGDSGPYGFVVGLKEFGMACIFAVTGLMTNFGANPAFDIGIIKDLPGAFIKRLLSPAIIPFVVNLGLFITAMVASVQLIKTSFIAPKQVKRRKKEPEFSISQALSILLIASLLVAIGLFVITNHYYPVDARYETIGLFALCVGTVTYYRTRPLPSQSVRRRIIVILLAGITIGIFWSFATARQQYNAYNDITVRNTKIADALQSHRTDLLVGDYWRVLPIKQARANIADVVPMGNCTTPRNTLTSKNWEDNFEKKSFTYLLTLQKGVTDYPACSIDQVTAAYGRPNASTVIAGTNDNPIELLLFYDQGKNTRINLNAYPQVTTILPITTDQVTKPEPSDCAEDLTVMNIVAHQDDDLLFMNPDVMHHITAGHCVRTIYVTAGDAGQNSQYWLGRERASEAAYESMLGIQQVAWTQRTVKLGENQYAIVANPKANRQVSLIFLRLPDGNLTGHGFGHFGFESLAGLLSGRTPVMQSVDKQSSYTSEDLVGGLKTLMDLYSPTQLNTQSAHDEGGMYRDHSDHLTVGQYADRAYDAYEKKATTPLVHYMGYPIRYQPENVGGDDLAKKTEAFLAYAGFDGGVCQSKDMCDKTPTYNAYLHRQYGQ